MTATRALRATVFAASLVGAIAICSTVGGVRSGSAIWPVLLAATVGGGLPVLLAPRWRTPWWATLSSAAVMLSSLSASFPGTTLAGLPTPETFDRLHHGAGALRAALSGTVPYRPVAGLVVVAAVLSGASALLSQLLVDTGWAARGSRGPHRLLALAPPLTLVACASLLGSIGTATVLSFAAVPVTLAVLALPEGRDVGSPRHRARSFPTASLVGAVAVSASALAGISVSAAGTPAASGATPVSAADVVSDVAGVERSAPTTVLFTSTAPVSTYWELGVLDAFAGGAWVPDPATAAALDGNGPPEPSRPVDPTARAGTFRTTVDLRALTGRLVPLPPDTRTVDAPFPVVRTASGAVAPAGLPPGARYSATVTSSPPPLDQPANPTVGLGPEALASALSLPPLPPVLGMTARSVAGDAVDPRAAAQRLENWFRSGAFRYSLAPGRPPSGVAGLVDFVTNTRVGDCEQFAGAFAVLARMIGLPTRVVIGFTGGVRQSDGTDAVRGVDAHAWPEVYLGPADGWVSFEPTPSRPAGELAPADVVGPAGLPTTTPQPTAPPVTGPPPTIAPPASLPGTSPPTVPVVAARSGGPGTAVVGVALTGALLVLLGSTALVLALRRRARGRARRLADPWADSWETVERAFGEVGRIRPSGHSPSAWIDSLASLATAGDGPDADRILSLLHDARTVAALLEQSVYAAQQPGPADAERADRAATRVSLALRDPNVRRALVAVVGASAAGPVSGDAHTTGSAMIRA